MPVVGKRMLIFIPYGWYGWRFVADVAEQTGPYSFRLENAFYIWNPGPGGGRSWQDLAAGRGRDQAEFVHYGEVYVGPDFGPCLEWKGELPSEGRSRRR